MKISNDELIKLAEQARKKAYAPYSSFFVGAALLCDDGSVYTGCNVENASFSPTCCAERVSIFKAVSEGQSQFEAIAVVGGKDGCKEPCYPCGVCRQVMREFCSDSFRVINSQGELTLGELLPKSFKLEQGN